MKAFTLFGALSTLVFSTSVHGGLLLQTDQPSYAVSTDGVTATTVTIYLVQTPPTTILTDLGGLNQFQISVTPVSSTNAPTLIAVHVNDAFTGNKIQLPSTGTLGGSFFDFTSGVPATDGRILLGTLEFTGSAATVDTTYLITTSEGYNWTASTDPIFGSDAVDIGSQITPGEFQITVVPEPASLAVIGAGVVALRRRRLVAG